MTEQRAIFTSQAPAPFPVFSQAIVRNDTTYCSGMVGLKSYESVKYYIDDQQNLDP